MEGILHVYHPKRNLLLFEYTPSSNTTSPPPSSSPQPPPNTLLFIGGMYDNFLHPAYTKSLAALFPRHPTQTWSVMQVQLSSNGRSFGLSSLDKDIDEVATAITYIRTHLRPNTPGNVVLLGHSTGCQDTFHYLTARPNPTKPSKQQQPRPTVQGAILQAPVSDREFLNHTIQTDPESQVLYNQAIEILKTTPVHLHPTTLLPLHLTTPLFGPVPLTLTRFHSLASPTSPSDPQPDDLFSHDLPFEYLHRKYLSLTELSLLQPCSTATITQPTILALHSSADDSIPPSVSLPQLLANNYTAAMAGTSVTLHAQSGVIEHGNHGLEGSDVRSTRAREVGFRERVLRYLEDVVGGVDEVAWRIWRDGKEEVEERESREGEGGGDGVKL